MSVDAKERFDWRLPLYAVPITMVICFLAATADSDGLLYLLLVVLVSLLLITVSLIAAIMKKPRRFLAILSMLIVFWVPSFAFLKNHYAVRNAARWSLWSHR